MDTAFTLDQSVDVTAGDIIDVVFFNADEHFPDWMDINGGISCDYGEVQGNDEPSDSGE